MVNKKSPLTKLWIGKATIYEYQEVVDETTHQSSHELTPIVKDEPCRLSYSSESLTSIASGVPITYQTITLFIAPTIDIKSGAVIEVTQHGKTVRFRRGTEASIYTDHQEVSLEYDEKYAQSQKVGE